MDCGVLTVDGRSNDIIRASSAVGQAFRSTQQALTGHSLRNLVVEADRVRFDEARAAALRDDEALLLWSPSAS